MTIVKICGITTLEDGLLAAGLGADMLGFNFYPHSPRYLEPAAARAITDALRERLAERCPLLVGVFVNAPDVPGLVSAAGLDAAQLHGDEPPEALAVLACLAFKALRPRDRNEVWAQAAIYGPLASPDARLPSLLVDAYHKRRYGGTGEQTSVEVALSAKEQVARLLLAGGLKPDNVGERIQAIRPWGVDVASGVEGEVKGRKDESALQAFMAAVRIADAAPN